MIKKIIFIIAVLTIVYMTAILALDRKIDKWDLSTIDLNPKTMQISMPKDFLWGVASASYQVEGGHGVFDSWGWWETQKKSDNTPRINGRSGKSNDEWNLYPKDIAEMKKLGLNSYRFSLSWSKIMPKEGTIDESALAHYDKLINALLDAGIEPMITLHHFSHPTWFEKKGAFDNEQNLDAFVKFSQLVFDRYGDRVKYWATFNEPVVYGFSRHIDLTHPNDFKEGDYNRLGNFLKNILIVHDKVYKTLKSQPNGKVAQIGITKSFMQMDPVNRLDLGDQIVAHFAQKLYSDAFVDYFNSGIFDFTAFPVGADVTHKSPTPKESTLDFIGLNYYSHIGFDVQYHKMDLDEWSKPLIYKDEVDTGMEYGYYPEGLYRAIRESSRLDKPIYITENGIGFPESQETLRQEHLKTALYGVSKAIKEGYDVRSYYYWTLNDNFEWHSGFSKTFGLYSVDRKSNELKRTPKSTANLYKQLIDRSKQTKPTNE